ncbi:MAG: DNA repair protein RadA [Patescibacteria group bacterium]|nr:DNA repair protein RadA [Patescibacteria group bacterium]
MKTTTSFVCQECGYESPEWLGKCPECGTWNSLREFKSQVSNAKSQNYTSNLKTFGTQDLMPKNLSEIKFEKKSRLLTGFSEMDGVLGGGLVNGSVTLLAGDPGIGKSTLLLQMALTVASRLPHYSDDARKSGSKLKERIRSLNESRLSKESILEARSGSTFSSSENGQALSVLYISGEESEEQIKLRAERLSPGLKNQNLLLLSATNVDAIQQVVQNLKPSLIIVDSIQTMESEALTGLSGSVGQVRYAALSFIRTAKSLNIPVIIVGHVTKEGMVAGPMILSHMVDTVLFLEGEKATGTRILRSLKNRFGPVDEVGIFVMEGNGMAEVKTPEQFFLSKEQKSVPGSVLVSTIEGTRAFLVELQSLVVFSKFPLPRRVAIGIDNRRLELLLAVLQKHCRLPFETMDVFVNVAGGLKIQDPGTDLGICLSLFSSFKNIGLGKLVCIGEVGLLGELRNVPFLDKRIKEAKKLGFRNIVSAKTAKTLNEVIKSIQ